MPAVEAISVPKRPASATKGATNEKRPHRCLICGNMYPKQIGNYPKTGAPIYQHNNGYVPYCNACCTQRYEGWVKKYGNEMKAIRRACEWLDLYYDPDVAEKTSGGIVGYAALLKQSDKNSYSKTWDDTLDAEAVYASTNLSEMSQAVKEGIELFGEGFPNDAYPMMLRTYHEYIDPLGNTVTAGQKKSARFLSSLEYRCMEAIRTDKSNASALSSSLTRAIKESGFDTVQEQSAANDEDTFGQWLEKIEMYTPAQYVKQTPYKDIDNLGEYYDRFVRRPIENLLNRASQMQPDELFITDEEADETDVGDSDDEA